MNEYRYSQAELESLQDKLRASLALLPDQKRLQDELEIEYDAILKRLRNAQEKRRASLEELTPFIPCFSDIYGPAIKDMMIFDSVRTSTRTAVGLTLTTLEGISFRRPILPQFQMAPWVIDAMPILERFMRCEIELKYLEKECDIVATALRRAKRKVAIVEMILIPQIKASIADIEHAAAYESALQKRRLSIARLPRNLSGEFHDAFREYPALREHELIS